MTGLDLVIFDCDGVLVNSEGMTSNAIASCLSQYGPAIVGTEVFARYLGKTLPQIAQDASSIGYDLPIDWCQMCERQMYAKLGEGVALSVGVDALISTLVELDIPIAVASNGASAKMQVTLGPSGIWDRFRPMILSGEDTGFPKPSPVMLEMLMQRAGAARCKTVMIDDSPIGRQAAAAAGCRFVGYEEYGSHDSFSEDCEFVARSMAEVSSILQCIGQGNGEHQRG